MEYKPTKQVEIGKKKGFFVFLKEKLKGKRTHIMVLTTLLVLVGTVAGWILTPQDMRTTLVNTMRGYMGIHVVELDFQAQSSNGNVRQCTNGAWRRYDSDSVQQLDYEIDQEYVEGNIVVYDNNLSNDGLPNNKNCNIGILPGESDMYCGDTYHQKRFYEDEDLIGITKGLCRNDADVNPDSFDFTFENGWVRDCVSQDTKDVSECYANVSYCGDKIIDTNYGETCDYGEDNGPNGECSDECKVITRECGNGELELGEECDYGEQNGPNDACATDCTFNGGANMCVVDDVTITAKATYFDADNTIYGITWTYSDGRPEGNRIYDIDKIETCDELRDIVAKAYCGNLLSDSQYFDASGLLYDEVNCTVGDDGYVELLNMGEDIACCDGTECKDNADNESEPETEWCRYDNYPGDLSVGQGCNEGERVCDDNEFGQCVPMLRNEIEICDDKIDNDCDGDTDDDDSECAVSCYQDSDGDGYGDANANNFMPRNGEICDDGYVEDNTDCNDDPAYNGDQEFPGNSDVCADGIDQDCSGEDSQTPCDEDEDMYVCTGDIPEHASSCEGDGYYPDADGETARSHTSSCSDVLCEYMCDDGYVYEDGECVYSLCEDIYCPGLVIDPKDGCALVPAKEDINGCVTECAMYVCDEEEEHNSGDDDRTGGDNFCGDGKIKSSEECDDGNSRNGDGCNSSCEIEDLSDYEDEYEDEYEEDDRGNTKEVFADYLSEALYTLEEACDYDDYNYQDIMFRDVEWDPDSQAINTLLSYCIVKGYDRSRNTKFYTDAATSKAEAIKILAKLDGMGYGIPFDETGFVRGTLPFKDMKPNAWYTTYVMYAHTKGLLDGLGTNNFLGSELKALTPILKSEMRTLLQNAGIDKEYRELEGFGQYVYRDDMANIMVDAFGDKLKDYQYLYGNNIRIYSMILQRLQDMSAAEQLSYMKRLVSKFKKLDHRIMGENFNLHMRGMVEFLENILDEVTE